MKQHTVKERTAREHDAKGLTRRGLIKRLGAAAALAPLLPLGKAVADKDRKRRRQKRLADLEDIWIGHC